MAKEKEKEDTGADIETDAPEKKPKKEKPPKQEGTMPLMFMVGGALGGVILIIVSVIIGTIIANKLFPPVEIPVAAVSEEHAEAEDEHGHSKKKLKPFIDDEGDMDDANSLLSSGEWLTFDSCKSQTNVRGSHKIFCIIDISAAYKPYYVEELTHKGFLTEAGLDGHGNPMPAGVDKNNELYKKLRSNVKSALVSFISRHSGEELQEMQSNGTLPDSVKTNLKNAFKDIGLVVGKVSISDFMVAGG